MLPIEEKKCIKIGEIIKPHGYKGEVFIRLNQEIISAKETEYVFLKMEGYMIPFFFASPVKPFKDGFLIHFEEINTPEEARALSNIEVYLEAEKTETDNGDSGMFMEENTEGFDVFDGDKYIGTAGDFLPVPSNPLLVVFGLKNEEILIPYSDRFIRTIDHRERKIIFELPEGLVELND
ncbi:MAG: 16S rRNA processing protein RimM [Bacteroidia bacterium]|nr:MAG: 16S rRNA processing protein RimM [Bacteroidia bacterium]